MTYSLINAGFLLAAVIVFILALRPAQRSRLSPAAVALTALILTVLTFVFNNLMIRAGLVIYGQDQISGVMVGVMPLEDLSYTVFAFLLLPALWELLGRRSARRTATTSGTATTGTAVIGTTATGTTGAAGEQSTPAGGESHA